MFSDMQTFTINGDEDKTLEKVLKFAIDFSEFEVEAFFKDKKGLVFCAYECDDSIKYPFKPTPKVLVEQIKQYIKNLTDEEFIELAGPRPDNDGIVNFGWEVFHPLWYGENEIENYDNAAILAVRPCWIVYGK